MSLKDRTVREIEKALKAAGAFHPEAKQMALDESYSIEGNKVVFRNQLRSMGHNEVDGPVRYRTYTEKELFPEDF